MLCNACHIHILCHSHAIILSRHLSLFGYFARMDDDADGKDPDCRLPHDWRPSERPISHGWKMSRTFEIPQPHTAEVTDFTQRRPLWRLLLSTHQMCTPT